MDAGTVLECGGRWLRVGEAMQRSLPVGLRTVYPLVNMPDTAVFRRIVPYELPRRLGSTGDRDEPPFAHLRADERPAVARPASYLGASGCSMCGASCRCASPASGDSVLGAQRGLRGRGSAAQRSDRSSLAGRSGYRGLVRAAFCEPSRSNDRCSPSAHPAFPPLDRPPRVSC
jgi:hypothetical protein